MASVPEFVHNRNLTVDELTERLLGQMPENIRVAVDRAGGEGLALVKRKAEEFLEAERKKPLSPNDLLERALKELCG